MELIRVSLILSLGAVGLKYLFALIAYFSGGSTLSFNFKQEILTFGLYFASFFIIFKGITLISDADPNWAVYVISLVSQFLLYSVSYLFSPALLFLKSDFKQRNQKTEEYIKDTYGKNYKVFVINSKLLNAFATGVLPFTKTILIGKPLLETLSEKEFQSILSHEVGHLTLNHLAKIFFIQVLYAWLVASLWIKISPFLIASNYFLFFLASYYGLVLGLGSLFILGCLQKKAELEADRFSAINTSPGAVIAMLKHLNNESNGKMEKWSFNYPTLNQRIENVKGL